MTKSEPKAKGADRGADEIDFLGTRQKSAPLGAPLARAKSLALVQRAVSLDSYVGGEAHDQGTLLIELYMAHVDASLGFRSFRAFLEKHWPLDVSVAFERMRVAKLMTRAQALKYGFSVCALGLRIMATLGETNFEDFLRKPLRLHADDGGGTVRFPASSTALRSVLRALATKEVGDAAPTVGETLRRYRATLDAFIATDPAVAAIKPVVWADTNGAYVRTTAGTRDELRTAAKLYERLARVAQ